MHCRWNRGRERAIKGGDRPGSWKQGLIEFGRGNGGSFNWGVRRASEQETECSTPTGFCVVRGTSRTEISRKRRRRKRDTQ